MSDAMSDPVEPAAKGPIHPYQSGLSDENVESGLEGILRLVSIAKHTATDSPNDCSMAIHQSRESHFRRNRRFG